ncbi:response regulator [Marinomonas sp. PE14-40]|uniref:response regulator n=1 Tax=Marinomonas sp. PE14-40 TaxID=3060621 RepID=UPI003F6798CF
MTAKQILYVEDNEDNIYMLKRRLERKGYQIHVAYTGEEGVLKVDEVKPDLILMDLTLPGISGFEAIEQIRLTNTNVPIIVLSAHAMDSYMNESVAVGANDFDTKPVDLKRLIQKIESLI